MSSCLFNKGIDDFIDEVPEVNMKLIIGHASQPLAA